MTFSPVLKGQVKSSFGILVKSLSGFGPEILIHPSGSWIEAQCTTSVGLAVQWTASPLDRESIGPRVQPE